jgi:hypothetical protein
VGQGRGPRLRALAVAALGMVVLSACGQSDGAGAGAGSDGDGVVVLAKAQGWRDGLLEATGHLYMLVEVTDDPDTARRAWDDNVPSDLPPAAGDPADPGVYGSLDDVDLRDQLLVVVSSGESGTCPTWVQGLSTTDGRLQVQLATGTDGPCTDDFRPYRMVLAVDRELMPALEDLPVDRIDVPSDNLLGVEGRVVAYPAGPDAPEPGTRPTEFDEPTEPTESTEFEAFDREAARDRALALLGVAEADVEQSAVVRVVRRGEEDLPVTMDLRPGRLNLELDDDGTGTFVVTRVVVEVPDDEDPLVVE